MEKEQKIIVARLAVTAFLLILSFFNFWSATAKLIISIVAFLIIAYDVMIESVKGIFKADFFDERFLMLIASIGAFILGEYHEALAVMLFYQLGEFLQDLAVDKSKDQIKKIMDIRPDTAHIEIDGETKTVSPETVVVGEIITVFAGERVPLDGRIVEGATSLDTSALTGESLPKDASIEDEVLAGTINLTATIKIMVTKPFGESTVSQIIELVENSESKKAKAQTFINKFAKIYTPVVVLLALLIAIIPPLGAGQSWNTWIYRALSFLVISCPCALVISIPLAFFAGIGGASKLGVLIKGATHIENLSAVNTVAFDKTGTLTIGEFSINEVHAEHISEKKLLEIAALAEYGSSHPIAKSIEKFTKKYNFDVKKLKSQEALAGLGVKAEIGNETYYVGNLRLIESLDIPLKLTETEETNIYVASSKKFLGYLTIEDTLKPQCKAAIDGLKSQGIKDIVMLTGDKTLNARLVADKLKINSFHAELLPTQKAEIIGELSAQDHKVAFVGDGINDAPVLAAADVGISMGKLGSDIAVSSADVVLMDDNPEKVAAAIAHSKKVMRIVRQNLVFTIAFKVLMLLLQTFGIANMWMAIFADVGVSLIAIVNSLRALKTKK